MDGTREIWVGPQDDHTNRPKSLSCFSTLPSHHYRAEIGTSYVTGRNNIPCIAIISRFTEKFPKNLISKIFIFEAGLLTQLRDFLKKSCRNACLADVRCQSYNVVMFENLCELNNRSKEARPGDFIENESRYHVCIVSERGINTKKCTVFFFKWLHMLVFAADYIRRTISRLTLTLWSLTSREALTMYCSVVKHAGSGSESTKKCREKHECFSPLLECSCRFLITVRY